MKTMYYAGMATLLVVVVMGFAACPTNSVTDKAAVSAALNTEKEKYQTGINLSGLSAGTDVSDKIVELVAGNKADATITRVVSRASSGWVDLSEKGKLVFHVAESKEAPTDDVQAEKAADPEEIRAKAEAPWREAMRDIQVVTLGFEKGGVTSYLDVLVAFNGTPTTVADTWLVYGYDAESGQPKTEPVLDRAKKGGAKTTPVLDMAKLNAASWIVTEGGKESLRSSNPEVLAMFAAQGFIDDVLSKTTGQIQAVYGTHLIVKAPKGGPKLGSLGSVADGDLISLWELEEAVKEMHALTGQDAKDANRQTYQRYPKPWVSAIDIFTSDKAKKDPLNLKSGWDYPIMNGRLLSMYWRDAQDGLPLDFNETTLFGPHIYGVFNGTDDPHQAIADLVLVSGKEDALVPPGYKKFDLDLNKGAGGAYVYLCYRKVTPADTEAVAWIGGISRWSKVEKTKVTDSGWAWANHKEGNPVETVRWVKKAYVWNKTYTENPDETPYDLNEGVLGSMYIYLTMEKRPFTW